jgi:hypothetical protein
LRRELATREPAALDRESAMGDREPAAPEEEQR